ncbi:MAG: cation diffusion facilitator family transporter [Rikenellaceae bacterium]
MKKIPKTKSRTKEIYHVTMVGFVVNLLLSVGKLAAGVLGHSSAMVADAIHSASDFATDAVVMLFVRISSKPQDADHNYGHGKYETLASILIGVVLAVVGCNIAISGAKTIVAIYNGEEIARPRLIALVAAGVSIIIKELLYRYTKVVGQRVNSPIVIANAWHHRTDALSSVGTLLGVGCAFFMGEAWRIADPIAAVVVSIMILKVAYDLCHVGIDDLLEKSLPRDVEGEIIAIISMDPKVLMAHNLRTRRIGSNISIEANIHVDGQMSVNEAHLLTDEIENRLLECYGENTLVSIHVEPMSHSL